MIERYMSVTEVAELFNVSNTLIYKLIKSEVLPAVKIGEKNYRISPEVIAGIKERGLLG